MPTLRARVEHVRDVLQEAVEHRFVVRGIAYFQGGAQLDADRTVHITSPDGRSARSPPAQSWWRRGHVRPATRAFPLTIRTSTTPSAGPRCFRLDVSPRSSP
jgi:hypothetical protein